MRRQNDIALLVPSFRKILENVLEQLRAKGFAPKVNETLRSAARAQKLVADGRSKAKGGLSMHCYGVAADVICARHGWSCKAAGCDFFEALGAEAEAHGLIWGGRWTTIVDKPHVQAVPVRKQSAIRRAPSAEVIDAIVADCLHGEATR